MRHLTVKAELSSDRKSVKVTILEQTHFRDDFAEHTTRFGYGRHLYFRGSTADIICNSHQDWAPGSLSHTGRDAFYVFGYSYHMGDPNKINKDVIPLDLWTKFQKAIEEYNEYYKE